MTFDEGDTIEEKIDAHFVMFYFNLCSGDYSLEYCESEIIKQEGLENYEACQGIRKAINFKKYGNSSC